MSIDVKLYCVLLTLLSVNFCASEKIISIEGGKIVGEEFDDYYAFKGIPYAEAPVGDLRFASPKPYSQKWEGVREYKNFSEVCAQYSLQGKNEYTGSEDCLYLNVYTPKSAFTDIGKAPVIVFFHGGAFLFGSSNSLEPDNVMKTQNLVLVTVNYRLGVLGFLSTLDDVIPGNFGLKDQVEALRWIQKNIFEFQGSYKKVTIAGFSAGGASVHLHYMSPLTDGMFNNGISHSGVALNPWVMMEYAREKAEIIARYFTQCPEDPKEMLPCLRTKPAKDLVMIAKNFQTFLSNPPAPFGVVVEPPSETAFLTDHPLNILKSGNFKKLPWMLSQSQDEGLYTISKEFFDDEHLKTLDTKWKEHASLMLNYDGFRVDRSVKLSVAEKIREHYLGSASISKENFKDLIEIFTDRLFKHGAFKALQLMSQHTSVSCYHYRNKEAKITAFGKTDEFMDFDGVSHGDDMNALFTNSEIEQSTSDEKSTLVLNFAYMYYIFARQGRGAFGNFNMEEADPEYLSCLDVFSAFSAENVLWDERFGDVEFWDEIVKELQDEEKKQKTLDDEKKLQGEEKKLQDEEKKLQASKDEL